MGKNEPEGVNVAHVVVAEEELLVLLLPHLRQLQQQILEDDEEDLHRHEIYQILFATKVYWAKLFENLNFGIHFKIYSKYI